MHDPREHYEIRLCPPRGLEGAVEVLRRRSHRSAFTLCRKGRSDRGYTWTLATHVEDVSGEEMIVRQKEKYGG